MKFDVDHALKKHAQLREAARASIARHEPPLVDLPLEAKLLAAILCDENMLERVVEVEHDDFSDYRYRAIFRAIRALEVRGEPIGPLEVADEIARIDRVEERHVADTVNDFFIAELVLTTLPFWGCESMLAWAKERLLTLAERRRAL